MNLRIGYYSRLSPNEVDINNDYDKLCKQVFSDRFAVVSDTEYRYYLDICHQTAITQRPKLLQLLRDCMNGTINLVVTDYQERVSENMQSLIFLLYFLLHLEYPVEIMILNCISTNTDAAARQGIIRATEQIVSMQSADYVRWEAGVLHALKA